MTVVEIPVKGGLVALVDEADAELVSDHRWYLTASGRTRAAFATLAPGKTALMHRLIYPSPPGFIVDHINKNGLDNRRANLRHLTHQQASWIRGACGTNRTGFKGVCPNWNRFSATICVNGRPIRLGVFETAEAAARAYDAAAKQHFGEIAFLNFSKPSVGNALHDANHAVECAP